MSEVNFQEGPTTEDTIKMLLEKLTWIMGKLDSRNVKRLDTNETHISSADGETVIQGPLLLMYDKQNPPVLRLQLGYDSSTGNFTFMLMDVDGNVTLGLNSLAQIFMTGKPMIEIYDDQVSPVLRLKMGFDIATSKFVFNMYDEAGNITITLNTLGEAKFQGNIETTKDAKIGNNLYVGAVDDKNKRIILYNSAGNSTIINLASDDELSINHYDDFTLLALGVLRLIGNEITISADVATIPLGDWNCGGANFISLTDGSSFYATRSWVNSQISGDSGTFTSADGKTITVEDGLIVSIEEIP
jgi:hypothetical protein